MKMQPVHVKSNAYIDSSKDIDYKDPKFRIGDIVGNLIYKNIFAKGYTPKWSEEVFVIRNLKNTVSQTYVINDLNGEEIFRTFCEKELQKTNKKRFRIVKAKKKKGDRLYVKFK